MRRLARSTRLVLVGIVLLALAGCRERTGEVDLLPLTAVQPPPTAYALIELPRDDAPHDVLTEWWYYTGHLRADDGRRYGFEYVIFQTVRGDFPVVYLGQLAITDQARGRFVHAGRMSQGSQIGRQDGLALNVGGWQMQG